MGWWIVVGLLRKIRGNAIVPGSYVLENYVCVMSFICIFIFSFCISCAYSVPDLPLCLGVLEHRAPLARVAHLPAKKKITMDFCLCGAILNLKAF
jgi:hypothetical protein